MQQGANKEERRQQKEILRKIYTDYNPVRHDVYVCRYNEELEKKALNEYMVNRGLSANVENA